MLIGYVETDPPVGEQQPSMRSGPEPGAAMFTALDANGDDMVSRDEAKKAIDRVPRLKENLLSSNACLIELIRTATGN